MAWVITAFSGFLLLGFVFVFLHVIRFQARGIDDPVANKLALAVLASFICSMAAGFAGITLSAWGVI